MGRPRLTGETMSRRSQDMHAEQELAKFLDENLYPFLEKSYKDFRFDGIAIIGLKNPIIEHLKNLG